MSLRTAFRLFLLANDAYANAKITAYKVDANGVRLTTFATLYDAPVGGNVAPNPFNLDGDGKLGDPLYHQEPIVCTIEGTQVPAHDTGVVGLDPIWRGDYATGTLYFASNVVLDAATRSLYVAQTNFTSSSLQADVTAGNLALMIDTGSVAAWQVTRDLATGDGSEDEFTLTVTPADVASLIVTVNGAQTTAWTLAGDVVTFTSAPANAAAIVFTTLKTVAGGGGANLGTIVQDGSGAIARNTDIIIKGLSFDIYQFGCDPAASAAENDAAIILAVAAANNLGALLEVGMRRGDYSFSAAIPEISTARGFDMQASKFLDTSAGGVVLLTLGGAVNQVGRFYKNIRVARSTQADWTTENAIGVRLQNLRNADVSLLEVGNFDINVQIYATGTQQCAHNEILLGRILNGKVAVDFRSNGANLAPNNNHLINGNITCDVGVNASLDRCAVRLSAVGGGYTAHNANLWDGAVAWQHGRAGGGKMIGVLNQVATPTNNVFKIARFEWPSSSIPSAYAHVRDEGLGGHGNRVEVEYNSPGYDVIAETATSGRPAGAWHAVSRRLQSQGLDAKRSIFLMPDMRGKVIQSGSEYGVEGMCVVAGAGAVAAAAYSSVCLRTSTNITPQTESVRIGASRGLGVMVDTTKIKRFTVVWNVAGGGDGGRLHIRACENGLLLDNSGGDLVWTAEGTAVAWNAGTLGWYSGNEMADASFNRRQTIVVADNVTEIQLAVFRGSGDIDVQSFAITADEPIQCRVWDGIAAGGNTGREFYGTSAAFNPDSLGTGAFATTTVTVTGAEPGDEVFSIEHADMSTTNFDKFEWVGRVTATDTVTVIYTNKHSGTVDLAAGDLVVGVRKRRA